MQRSLIKLYLALESAISQRIKERIAMTKHSQDQPPTGQTRQPRRMIDDTGSNDFDREQVDLPIDDPGDAQRSSKSEQDGDGEEGPLNPGRGYPPNPDL